jgi:uncharacterized surface protein with fasciclin (FAS1) repeats
MSRHVVAATVVGATAAFAVGLAAAGCGADGSLSARPTLARAAASDGKTMGCIGDMASAPVVSAIGRIPWLSQLARAIGTAGLARSLNTAKALTVFAPEDSAFAALGRGNLATLLADRSDLAKMLKDHLVSGRVSPSALASGRRLTTLLGTLIVPTELRGKYRVNNAGVVCGNIRTANATIYIVNKVLVPVP